MAKDASGTSYDLRADQAFPGKPGRLFHAEPDIYKLITMFDVRFTLLFVWINLSGPDPTGSEKYCAIFNAVTGKFINT